MQLSAILITLLISFQPALAATMKLEPSTSIAQDFEWRNGTPVIVSGTTVLVAIVPIKVTMDSKERIAFHVLIQNDSEQSIDFSTSNFLPK
jgi:hypothetical protein